MWWQCNLSQRQCIMFLRGIFWDLLFVPERLVHLFLVLSQVLLSWVCSRFKKEPTYYYRFQKTGQFWEVAVWPCSCTGMATKLYGHLTVWPPPCAATQLYGHPAVRPSVVKRNVVVRRNGGFLWRRTVSVLWSWSHGQGLCSVLTGTQLFSGLFFCAFLVAKHQFVLGG